MMPVVDLYTNEPPRDPRLVVRSSKPFNAEMPLGTATEPITPNELFYVRNHLPVPEVDPEKHESKPLLFCSLLIFPLCANAECVPHSQ